MRSKISCLLKIGTSYVVSLFVIYYIHVRFFPVNVVFYAAIADGVIATLLTALLLKSFKSFEVFNNFEKLLILFSAPGRAYCWWCKSTVPPDVG